ncbi:beta-ketoacyl-ACP synthase II [Verrucomicrobiota bacterium]
MERRRVVITGMGAVTPIGNDVDTYWNSLVAGKSGIARIQGMDDIDQYAAQIGAQLKDFDPLQYVDKKTARKMDPYVQFGMAAAVQAMQDSGLDMDQEDSEKIGVIVSTGVGGLAEIHNQEITYFKKGPKRFSPFMIPKMIGNILSGEVAIRFGLQGPNFGIVTACASATHSIGEALRIIQHGEADAMVVGGAEAAINPLGLGGFCALKALNTDCNDDPLSASRPFDANRSGFVMGEGAGVLVIEEYERAKARGAKIYCEVAGYGRTCDAYHITAPDVEAKQAARCLTLAATDAGVNLDEVQYLNAHGTSTPLNDKTETAAVKRAFGEEIARKMMISSGKSMTGHLLGAAGGIEAIACAKMLETGIITPTINYENPDPDCDLDYVPNEAREVDLKVALSNSLGFGGHNGTVAFKKI